MDYVPRKPVHETMRVPRSGPSCTEQNVLTRIIVNNGVEGTMDVGVIDDPAAAVVALDPIRSRLLAELREPASADAGIARTHSGH